MVAEIKMTVKLISLNQYFKYIYFQMRSTPNSALKVMLLPSLYLFISKGPDRRLKYYHEMNAYIWPTLGTLIKMTGETSQLLFPREKFVTLNIFDRKFSVDSLQESLFHGCVYLVVPDHILD
jgi:hypothetical protein